MLDFLALQNSRKQNDWDDLTDTQKTMYLVTSSIIIIFYITFFIWALLRASNAPSNKPLHLLFALISPGFYLIFSYFVKDFY
jgi:hypothetical protein